MRYRQTKVALILAALIVPQLAAAQDVRLRVDEQGRQCARQGTDLHDYLQTALPNCSKYCLVKRDPADSRPETMNTMIFNCADEDRTAAPLPGTGLRAAAALGLLGLLLSSSGGPSGATSDTQSK